MVGKKSKTLFVRIFYSHDTHSLNSDTKNAKQLSYSAFFKNWGNGSLHGSALNLLNNSFQAITT
ncbi:hypothetical protein D046_8109 [Vibrio parahaemolyticus V-223/04]|nr:hypothetical protein D046_8109 [Vibrio parahaemolyticus V-223/04]